MVALALAGAVPGAAGAQQPAAAARSLVFDSVTVIDVEQGKLAPDQRVVIAGNRIQAIGSGKVPLPKDAQVVSAQGKYLIPGLWDMHAHVWTKEFIARGVTGIRQPGQLGSIEDMVEERRKILAGEIIGPRTIFAGPFIETWPGGQGLAGSGLDYMVSLGLLREDELPSLESRAEALGGWRQPAAIAVLDSFLIASGRIDSVVVRYKAEGADFLKLRDMSSATMYFAFAAAARRHGIPFGGHAEDEAAIDVSDSGASIIDHVQHTFEGEGGLAKSCLAKETARLELCQPIAEHFRRNGTWWVPTLAISTDVFPGWWRCHYTAKPVMGFPTSCSADTVGMLTLSHRVGMPIMAGTDDAPATVEAELAVFVAEGLTPLEALQSATLNPAKYLHGTDSLGTVAAGKLADLVLLDANPLADIANVRKVRAVVANGRYFDRAALDELLQSGR